MRYVLISLPLLLCACVNTPKFPVVTMNTIYEVLGAKVIAPDQSSWKLLNQSNTGVIFARSGANPQTASAIASTQILQVGEFSDRCSFLEYVIAERVNNDDKSRFFILRSESTFLTYQETDCFRYKTLSEDHGSDNQSDESFQYFSSFWKIFHHPEKTEIAC